MPELKFKEACAHFSQLVNQKKFLPNLMVVLIFEKWTVLNTLCNYATTSQKNTAPYFLTENLLAVSEFYLFILRPTDGDIWQSQQWEIHFYCFWQLLLEPTEVTVSGSSK